MSTEGSAVDGQHADIRAAMAGDRLAFAALYRDHARMVHAILLAHAPRPEVDDLLQDVFTVALAELGTLRQPEAFPGWLARIARNLVTDLHRRRRDTQPLDEHLSQSPPPSLEAREALAAIRELPEAYREPLLMRLVEGLSGAEIAALTGMTHGSVRVNLHRGMNLLRARLGAQDTEPKP